MSYHRLATHFADNDLNLNADTHALPCLSLEWGELTLQFAINTSKPPAPVALQGRLCLSAKPHEYKRSLVWLNLPYLAKLGIPRAGRPPLSISILQR